MEIETLTANGSRSFRFCCSGRSTLAILLGSIFFLLLSGSSAWAHKVNLFAYVESGIIYTESYFADGKRVESGTISIYDRQGKQLLQGKTDTEGLFHFPIPTIDDLKIVIDAGMGHKSAIILKKKELEEGKE